MKEFMHNPIVRIFMEVIPIAIIAATIGYVAVKYPSLPSEFPTHFGFNGVPNSYGETNFINVFLLPIIMVVIYLLFALINQLMLLNGKSCRKYINLPFDAKKQLPNAFYIGISTEIALFMYITKIIVILLLADISIESILVANEVIPQMSPIIYLFLAGLILPLIPFLIRWNKLSKQAESYMKTLK